MIGPDRNEPQTLGSSAGDQSPQPTAAPQLSNSSCFPRTYQFKPALRKYLNPGLIAASCFGSATPPPGEVLRSRKLRLRWLAGDGGRVTSARRDRSSALKSRKKNATVTTRPGWTTSSAKSASFVRTNAALGFSSSSSYLPPVVIDSTLRPNVAAGDEEPSVSLFPTGPRPGNKPR